MNVSPLTSGTASPLNFTALVPSMFGAYPATPASADYDSSHSSDRQLISGIGAAGKSLYMHDSTLVRSLAVAANMIRHAAQGIARFNDEVPFRIREWPKKNTAELLKYKIRSQLTGLPFVIAQSLINWEIHGRNNLLGALKMAERENRGIILVSNHKAFYDDPLMYIAALELFNYSYRENFWAHTADAVNFNPQGNSLAARATRYFFEPTNMIFLERSKNREGKPPTVLSDPWMALKGRLDNRTWMNLGIKANQSKMSLKTYLQTYLTNGEDGINGRYAPLNQIGLVEAIAKVDGGQVVHMFPEGTRSRTIHPLPAKPGVGKAIYHARDAIVLPIAHHGMHKVSPVGKFEMLPRPFHTVIVNIGKPIPAHLISALRALEPDMETFSELSNLAMDSVNALRPFVLERYYGARRAAEILEEELLYKEETFPESALK